MDRLRAFASPKSRSTDQLSAPAWRYHPYYVSDQWGLAACDELVQTRGLAVYREMEERDDQVASCLSLLRFARLASGWEITPVSGDATDREAAEFIRFALDRMTGYSMQRLLMDSMDSFGVGFSCIEKVLGDPYAYGEFRGKQGYRTMRPLPQETVTFKTDEFGEMEPDGVWQAKPGQMVSPGLDPSWFNRYERDRFVVWALQRKWSNPLGMSLLRPAHGWYEFKRFTLKHWARYTERYGLPRGTMEVPKGTSAAQMAEAADVLRRYQSDLAMVFREGMKPTFDEPTTTATMNFESNVTAANKGIAHSLFLPSTIMDNTEGGSFALAKAQKSTFTWVLDYIGEAQRVEVVRDQVVRPLIDWNYGPEVDCPNFSWRDYSQPDRESIARMYASVTQLGMPVSRTEVREVLGLREPVDEADAVSPPVPLPPAGMSAGPAFPAPVSEEETALNALIENLQRVGDDRDGRIAVLRGQRP